MFLPYRFAVSIAIVANKRPTTCHYVSESADHILIQSDLLHSPYAPIKPNPYNYTGEAWEIVRKLGYFKFHFVIKTTGSVEEPVVSSINQFLRPFYSRCQPEHTVIFG